MGTLEKLKKAYQFVTGEESLYGGTNQEMFIGKALELHINRCGPIGVAGLNLGEIYERVTGEKPEFKERVNQEIRRELKDYGVLPVILPEIPKVEEPKTEIKPKYPKVKRD